MSYKFFIHYGLHFVFPIVVALLINKKQWLKIYFLLVITMLIDLDHLLATPVYDANRCSINFHPLHHYISISFYVFGLFFRKTRIIALGLILHILTDWLDCFL